MSILPNLAIKVDRLLVGQESSSPAVEDLLDTTADLFVYAAKYKAFLLDESAVEPPRAATTWAAGTAGVDHIIADLTWSFVEADDRPLARAALLLDDIYSSIKLDEPAAARLSLSSELVIRAQALLLKTISSSPNVTMSIVRAWSG